MSAEDQNQNYEKLQQLLKLKRYEQPHPRYFNELSSQVTARLRAGETARLDNFEEAMTQTPWLRRLWRTIEGHPALSGLVTAGTCGLLLLGGFMTGNPTMQPGLAVNGGEAKPAPANESLLATTTTSGTGLFSSSPNPTSISSGAGSLFSMPLGPGIQTQPVSARPNP